VKGKVFSTIWRGLIVPLRGLMEYYFYPTPGSQIFSLLVEVLGLPTKLSDEPVDVMSFEASVLGYRTEPPYKVSVLSFDTEVLSKVKSELLNWVQVHSTFFEVVGKKSVYTVPAEAIKVHSFEAEVLAKKGYMGTSDYAGVRLSRISSVPLPNNKTQGRGLLSVEYLGTVKETHYEYGFIPYIILRWTMMEWNGRIFRCEEWKLPFWFSGEIPYIYWGYDVVDIVPLSATGIHRILSDSNGPYIQDLYILEVSLSLLHPVTKHRATQICNYCYEVMRRGNVLKTVASYYFSQVEFNRGGLLPMGKPMQSKKFLAVMPLLLNVDLGYTNEPIWR